MARADRDFVGRVKAALDIVQVIQAYVPLAQKSGRFVALCPFHREKTPSFWVHPEKQIFHCFGCGKGGDVVTFVMEMDRLSFGEALRHLAGLAGLPLPETRQGGAAEGRRERLLAALLKASEFYVAALRAPGGARALEYLRGRGLTAAALERFALGCASGEWRSLHSALRSRGFTDDELLAAGLVKANEAGHKWDLLRNRIVIPIRDARGRVIAFGGRALDDTPPKYLNSPETELFSKRNVLFGLDKAARAAAAAGCFVVVEGYMDVIAAHQRGVENVVAALGTAFTVEHVAQLRRHAGQIVLLFDADEGGQRAADRGATLLVREGLDVAIATLPAGQDPDDFFRTHEAAAFWSYLAENKEDMIAYLIRRAREEAGEDAGVARTVRAARSVLKLLEGMDDAVQFDLYVRRISQEFGVDEALLRQDMRRSGGAKRPVHADEATPPRAERGMLRGWELDEVFILHAAATDAAVAERVVEALSEADFRDTGRRVVFMTIRDIVKGSQSPAPSVVLEQLKDNAAAVGALQVALGRPLPPEETVDDLIERMTERRKDVEYRRAREEAGRSGVLKSSDDDELDPRLDELARYHVARYARSKDQERQRHDAGEA